jgi:phosphoglucosamine mutase
MAKLFGTDGIRGEAGRFPLDAPTVRVIGRSLANHLTERLGRAPFFVIGRDTRESGAWIEAAFVAGAREAGADCESAGVITTPGVATLARILPADAGVVLSASHNPFHDNGIKIFTPGGRKLDDATERLIEADIAAASDEAASDVNGYQTDEIRAVALRARYLVELRQSAAKGLSLKGQKIVLDCANGAASHLAPELFASLGAEVVATHCAPDGQNINHDCGSLHLDGLQAKVVAENADLGVAFDGDADRALFVDANGAVVDGDATLWVMAQYLAARRELAEGLVVATVMSNIGLEIALRTRGWTLKRTDVGDKYVLEELLNTGAAVGGEQSGHIIFPARSLAGDGMMTALLLLQAVQAAGRPLHELAAGFTRYPQTLVNVRVREKRPFGDVPEIAAAARAVEADLGDGGRLLLRYSGTESLARVMIEGADQKKIEAQAHELAAVIGAALGK